MQRIANVLAFCWDIFKIAPKVPFEFCWNHHFLTQKPYALPFRKIKSQKKATVWPWEPKVMFLTNCGLFTWGGAQLKRKKLNFSKSDFRVTFH